MKTLLEIAKGWRYVVFPDEAHEQLFRRRLQVCDNCPSKRQMSPAGEWITRLINDEANTFYCGECGCPLAALLRVPEKECKLKRWLAETINP